MRKVIDQRVWSIAAMLCSNRAGLRLTDSKHLVSGSQYQRQCGPLEFPSVWRRRNGHVSYQRQAENMLMDRPVTMPVNAGASTVSDKQCLDQSVWVEFAKSCHLRPERWRSFQDRARSDGPARLEIVAPF